MKIFKGKIVSLKMNKTATVEVSRIVVHSMYGKRYRRSKKYQVHADGEHVVGDLVQFAATKPISKTKKWKILEEKKKGKK